MSKALGLVETIGLIGAIEAADAGLKSANVLLIDKELATGGLVTVKFVGDVSAVKAAVEAASVAAQKVSKVVSVHVIARTANDLEKIIYNDDLRDETNYNQETKNKEAEADVSISQNRKEFLESSPRQEMKTVRFRDQEYNVYGPGGIEDLKVVDIRSLARDIKIKTIERQQIRSAKKSELLDAMRSHFERGEE